MLKGRFATLSLQGRFLLFAVIFLLSLVLAVFLVGVATLSIVDELAKVRLGQLFQHILVFALPALLSVYLWSVNPFDSLGLKSRFSWLAYLLVGFLMISLVPFVNMLGELNKHIYLPQFLSEMELWMLESERNSNRVTALLLGVGGFNNLIVNILLIAVLPAFCEEVIFRGVLQNQLSLPERRIRAVWVTAIVFSAIHFQFYGFLPRMFLGALLGYLYLWSGDLWLSIWAHFVNNAMAILYYFFKSSYSLKFDLDQIGTGSTWFVSILSAISVFLFLYFIRRLFLRHSSAEGLYIKTKEGDA